MPVISTNLAANSAVRYLNINSASQTSSLSKLASGSRITQASDDAAGLAISTKISSDVTALNQAATNASHGISVLQTADGGASNISDILQRMKALASQAASGTVTDNERAYIDAEFQQLIDEVDAISVGTRYNGQSLLDGTSAFANGGINVMVGSDAADVITVTLDTLNAAGLGLNGSNGVTNTGGPQNATVTGGAFGVTTAADLTINGETVSLTAGMAIADVETAINAVSAASNVTASVVGGVLVLTSTGTAGAADAIDIGGDITGTGLTVAVTNGSDAGTPADIVLDLSGGNIDASAGNISFDVNGTTVTLTATGGDGAGSYDAAALATAIQDALDAAGITGVTATAAGTDVTLANSATGATAEVSIENFSTGFDAAADFGLTLTASPALSAANQESAVTAIGVLDDAISTVSKARANIGSLESRFGFHQASIATSVENLTAAISAIKDTDVASEAAKLASAKVKTQAAVASAAQASQMPQELLKLLQ